MDAMERVEKFFLANLGQNINEDKPREMPYTPRPTDVMVVGAPKSGTTWLQQILHQIRTKGDENFEDIYMITWWLPYKAIKYDLDLNGDQVANPRIYKCHDRFDILPRCDGAKYIFIARDPYDCQWSFTKFFLRWAGSEEDLSEEMALDIFQLGSQLGDDYFGLIISWYSHRNDPNVLWLHYEDLKQDLRFCIQKISEFLEIPLNETELSRVYDFCTFEYMSKHDKKFAHDSSMESIARSIGTERWTSNCGMVRKDGGRVGDGRKCLGPKLKEAVAQRWQDTVAKELGFEDYEALFNEMSFLKRQGRK